MSIEKILILGIAVIAVGIMAAWGTGAFNDLNDREETTIERLGELEESETNFGG